jgi:hypothetical protein
MLRLFGRMFGQDELHPKTNRVLLTAHAAAGTPSELSGVVVRQFIPKPWEAAAVCEAPDAGAAGRLRAGRLKPFPFPPSLPSRK